MNLAADSDEDGDKYAQLLSWAEDGSSAKLAIEKEIAVMLQEKASCENCNSILDWWRKYVKCYQFCLLLHLGSYQCRFQVQHQSALFHMQVTLCRLGTLDCMQELCINCPFCMQIVSLWLKSCWILRSKMLLERKSEHSSGNGNKSYNICWC